MAQGKKLPKYQIIENDILNQINSGELKVGERLMAEEEICKQYGVSRMTANKALQSLVASGYVKRISGKGSFIRMPKVSKSAAATRSFSKDMRSIGLTPGAKLIEYKIIRGKDDPRIMEILNLCPADMIHYFRRLRTGDDIPIAISNTYVPVSMISELDVTSLESSFYEYVEQKLGFIPTRKNFYFEACMFTEGQRELLEVDDGCLLKVSSAAATPVGEPFDYSETYYISSRFVYNIELD